jgi:hypothetical protein
LRGVPLFVLGILINNRKQISFFRQRRGLRFACVSIALDLLYYLVSGLAVIAGRLLHETVGEPRPDAVTQAYSEVGAKHWPPVRTKRALRAQAVSATPA